MAYPAINDAQFSKGLIALLPVSEQSRIVARVQELMTILDRLEGKLAARDKAAILASM